MKALCTRLFEDERGQDQVEYALLTVLVGLLGVASAGAINNAITLVYGSWIGVTNGLWESPSPAP